jgi:hypothetical protein
MKTSSLILFTMCFTIVKAQEKCDPVNGHVKTKLEAELNPLKNRTAIPSKISSAISLSDVLKTGDDTNRFSNDDAAEITGYVVVKPKLEGKESCNCDKTDSADRDYHIEIALKATEKSKSNMMVVEITPKLREKMKWSPKEIEALQGHEVKFTGWMLFDKEHIGISRNTAKKGAKEIVRATAWEIHPITSFSILK